MVVANAVVVKGGAWEVGACLRLAAAWVTLVMVVAACFWGHAGRAGKGALDWEVAEGGCAQEVGMGCVLGGVMVFAVRLEVAVEAEQEAWMVVDGICCMVPVWDWVAWVVETCWW